MLRSMGLQRVRHDWATEELQAGPRMSRQTRPAQRCGSQQKVKRAELEEGSPLGERSGPDPRPWPGGSA